MSIRFPDNEVKLPLQWNADSKVYTDAVTPELDRNDIRSDGIYELDDLLPMYPDQDIPNIQTYITAKKEFNELASIGSEKITRRGQFFNHQQFFHRYMYHYPRIFNMQKAGTGKTGAAAGFAQSIRRNLNINETLDFVENYRNKYRSNIKRTVILVSNSILKKDFKTHIVYRYSAPGDYDIESLNSKDNETSKNKSIGKMLKGFFIIETYSKFSNMISDYGDTPEGLERLKKAYSDTLFIVDEGHNIRTEIIDVGFNPATGGTGRTVGSDVPGGKKKTKVRDKKVTYFNIHRLFHIVERSIFIIMTATPMINDASEIIELFNLILPLDKQFGTTREDRARFKNMTLEQLEPYYRGKISFVKESASFVIKKYVGEIIKDAKTGNPLEYKIQGKIYRTGQLLTPLPMSVDVFNDRKERVITQGYIYRQEVGTEDILKYNVTEEDIDEEILLEESNEDTRDNIISDSNASANVSATGNFFKKSGKARQICNGIFPDGSYGKAGFTKYIKLDPNIDDYIASPELKEAISNPEHLKLLTVKYSFIKDLLLKPEDFPGPCYSYTHLKEGSGAIYLGLCLEEYGFAKYSGKKTAFKRGPVPTNANPSCTPAMEDQYCTPDEIKKVSAETEMEEDFPKRLRYAILTSGMTEGQIYNIMTLYSSDDNIDGEYLKYLIITPVGREGINLSNSSQFILIDPSWNPSSQIQAESRGDRETSHIKKTEELRIKTGDPNAKSEFEIYKLAAYDPYTQDSVDKQLYMLTELKDIEIKNAQRNMKIVAIDNTIHKERNQPPTEEIYNYTSICDYNPCQYDAYDPLPPSGYIDYTSYDLLYSDEAVDKIISEIKNYFRTNNKSTVLNIVAEFTKKSPMVRPKITIRALFKIIYQKIALVNRFGFNCYLLEDQGMLFTQNEFPIVTINNYQNKYDLSYYTQYFTIVEEKKLEDYISDEQSIQQNKIVEEIERSTGNAEDVLESFEKLTIDKQIELVEKAIVKKFFTSTPGTGPGDSKTDTILKHYEKSWYKIKDPVMDIMLASQKLSTTLGVKKRPGRKAKPSVIEADLKSVSPYRVNLPQSNQEGEEIFIHILYGDLKVQSTKAISPNYKKAEGQIRLVKSSDMIWRDANEAESMVYREVIISLRSNEMSSFEQYPYYGTLLSGGKFRIVVTQKIKSSDKRQHNTGMVATSYHNDKLIEMMYTYNIKYNEVINLPNLQEMYNYLSNSGFAAETLTDINKISYFYTVSKTAKNKPVLIKYVRDYMELNGMIYKFKS
jgi:hypothetical protein